MGSVSTGNSTTQSLSSLLGTNSSTTGTSSTNSTTQNISGAQQSLAGDQQTFLTLLTTQLQNQDPTSPMDTDQFTQQLVAMTGVQQQILTNQLLQQLVGNQTGVGEPVDLLGKSVTATSSQAVLQNGQASWQFSTAAQAADVKVTVTNDLGQTVDQQDLGAMSEGQQSFTWNGKDENGVQAPNGGTYTLAVTATDASGNSVSTTIYQQGTVSSVDNSGGQVTLTVNGDPLPASSVTSVQNTQ